MKHFELKIHPDSLIIIFCFKNGLLFITRSCIVTAMLYDIISALQV